ncbi:MAG: hypothetical protein LC733_01295, partial [Actinobacteria bacterium]|nr:hypothetical protein [Actinomycetota bacterium]
MNARRVVVGTLAMALLAGSCGSEEGKGTAKPAAAVFVNQRDRVLPLSRAHEAPALLIDKDDRNTV